MENQLEQAYLDKIRGLEQEISGLRISRRLFAALLEESRRELEAENKRLLCENQKLNRRVLLLCRRLRQQG